MKPRKILPRHPVTELTCGEFHRGFSYTNYRPRGSGDWLLIYTEAGAGRFVSASGSRDSAAGDAVLYAPEDLQDYSTPKGMGKWRLLWVHFIPKPHWQMWLSWPVVESGLRLLHLEQGDVRDGFRNAMLRMIHVSRRKIPGALDFAANALEEALLWGNIAGSKDQWLAMDFRVRKAIDYLVDDLRKPFRLDMLARHCGASVSRMAHLFKEQTNSSPRQFLERHRMQRACQLLRLTNLSIAEIAAEAGYADAFYFSNRFRRYAGKSPSQYREQSAI
jgi:AraC family transcriptional regulator of arabinose operon